MTLSVELVQRYMFTLEAEISEYRAGETPQGTRVDLEYQSGEVSTDGAKFRASWAEELEALKEAALIHAVPEAADCATWLKACRGPNSKFVTDTKRWPEQLDWFGLDGKVLSGSDWALVRRDGVVEFSARVSLQEEFGDSKNPGVLINATFSGVVDLWDGIPARRPQDPLLYETWKNDKNPDEKRRIGLVVKFDAASASQPWAAKEYKGQSGFWKFARLTRGLFAVDAWLSTRQGAVSKIEMDIWSMVFAGSNNARESSKAYGSNDG